MGNFAIPMYQYIVNSDVQLSMMGDDGTGPVDYPPIASPHVPFLVPTNPAHKFSMVGELDWNKVTELVTGPSGDKVVVNGSSLGQRQRLDCTIQLPAGATAPKGSVIRVITHMPALEDTAYQNQPLEKRYTLSKDCTTEVEIANDIVAIINADKSSLVEAFTTGTPGTIYIYDKLSIYKSSIYASKDTEGKLTFNVVAAIGVEGKRGYNHYGILKNLQWSNGVDFDRNGEYYPIKGDTYKSYNFKVIREEIPVGGFSLPSEIADEAETEYVFYINDKLTDVIAQFEQFAADMNV